MPYPTRFFWKKIPVSRLVIPFFLGIACQYYWPAPVSVLQGIALVSSGLIGVYSFSLLPFFSRFRSGFVNGLSVFSLFVALGALSVWQQDIRKSSLWLGNIYQESDALVIKLRENLSEKQKTFKTAGCVIALVRNDSVIPVKAGIYVYLRKEVPSTIIKPGDVLVTSAKALLIPPRSAPGAFDYREYSLFQGITHQVFLKNDFIITGNEQGLISRFINGIRGWVLTIFENAFPGRKERGLAEALLIGHKDELDKALVQSYTNTGVVHIIAISGLHLGLIYWLLVKLLQPLSRLKQLKWLPPVMIIAGLWIFTLLAGAQPSVLRSAIMFTCIVIGNSIARQSNVLNSLAVSAFILLCYNPFWLWDAGFQLSYAAIIGIVIFMKPVYQLLSFQNKLVDMIWQMNAVTISAQLLTLPICIYQFHQFPNYFLLSNIIAVPLSSLILLLEIFLCAISFLPSVFSFIASLTALLIRLMNACVERVEQLPFSVWNGLQISFVQAVLLSASLVLLLSCLLYKEHIRALLYTGFIAMAAFVLLRCLSFIKAGRQQMLIVYQRSADLIQGRAYSSIYGAETDDAFLVATRSLFRLQQTGRNLFIQADSYYSFLSKKIILIDQKTGYSQTDHRQDIDLVILSQKTTGSSYEILQAMNIRQVVADASVPAYTARQWQMECEAAGIPFHDVRAKGAFVMKF